MAIKPPHMRLCDGDLSGETLVTRSWLVEVSNQNSMDTVWLLYFFSTLGLATG